MGGKARRICLIMGIPVRDDTLKDSFGIMIGLLSCALKKDDLMYGQSSVSYENGNRFKPAIRPEKTKKEEKEMKKIAFTAAIIAMVLSLSITSCVIQRVYALQWHAWPTYNHDAQRTGRTDAYGPYWLFRLWTFDTGYSVTSSPVIDEDGNIYFGSMDTYPPDTPKLYKLNNDGTPAWTRETNWYGKISTAPALSPDGSKVYVGTHESSNDITRPNFFAIDTATSNIIWSYKLPNNEFFGTSNPVVVDVSGTPVIYVCSDHTNPLQRALYKIPDLGGAHGTVIRWNNPAHLIEYPTYYGIASPSPAVASDGTIYIGVQGGLSAIDPVNLVELRYIQLAAGEMFFSPAVREVGGTKIIYVGSTNYRLYAVEDTGNFALRWSYQALNNEQISTCPAIKDLGGTTDPEIVFASSTAPNLSAHAYAITDDGHHPTTPPPNFWAPFAFPGEVIASSPAIDYYNAVYVCTASLLSGNIHTIAWDGTNWRIIDTYNTGGPIGSSPAITSPIGVIGGMGMLLVGSCDNHLYCIACRIPPGPRPTNQVSVDCVTVPAREVYSGWPFNAIIRNAGNSSETANVTAYLDHTVIGAKATPLPPETDDRVDFIIPFEPDIELYANYTLRVEVSPVPGETILGDNVYIYGYIVIKKTGDVNCDKQINIIDIATAAKAFGTKPGDPRWDVRTDINADNQVNIIDIATIARMFGWKA
jgi:hypothetical protein